MPPIQVVDKSIYQDGSKWSGMAEQPLMYLLLPRWNTSSGLPIRTMRHVPVSMTFPVPITIPNDLLLCLYEGFYRTHAVLLLGAPFDSCQGSDAIVDDDSDLRSGGDGRTFEELELNVGSKGSELCYTEGAVVGDVGVWQGSASSKAC